MLQERPLPGPWHWSLESTFEEAMQKLEDYDAIAIDVPLSSCDADLSNSPEPGIHDRYRRPPQKIEEVHDFMRGNPGSARLLYEVHPRLSFLELEGGVMLPRKE